ncbi:hypothetical protein AAHA92_27507 [Salvia divinorum]|uniref:Uncharacterized protein n=1 Tax=Salvia divinorum TaxID=28513 RepID=A0ABD1G3V7_SALDI
MKIKYIALNLKQHKKIGWLKQLGDVSINRGSIQASLAMARRRTLHPKLSSLLQLRVISVRKSSAFTLIPRHAALPKERARAGEVQLIVQLERDSWLGDNTRFIVEKKGPASGGTFAAQDKSHIHRIFIKPRRSTTDGRQNSLMQFNSTQVYNS